MNTPICDFVKKYAAQKAVRAHMPGHKGFGSGSEAFDITEIPGADVLYHSDGIIRGSEENAAHLFGTARTVYSTEGSSLSIRAMLYLIKLYAAGKGEKARILAGRNAHKVFISAAALLDIEVEWIFPVRGQYISCDISGERLEKILSDSSEKPTAVYITSPDYLGNIADIRTLVEVCHRHNVLLIVDNAHGAYLKFLPESQHPIALGADMCSDSAHKTLPALTGAGYLHISADAPAMLADNAEKAMALFASTSPSYLILQSLDRINHYLSEQFRGELDGFIKEIAGLKKMLIECGYRLIGSEPLKITISCKEYGYTGNQMAKILEQSGIYCEFCDPDYLVMMFTPQNQPDDLKRVGSALTAIPKKTPLPPQIPVLKPPVQIMTPREAIMANCAEIPSAESVGRVLGGITVSCPPAIPIVVCGEQIGSDAAELFSYYGIEKISVVS